MSDYININDSHHVHLTDVKKISRITDKERQSLATLGEHVKAEEFNTRIDHANRSKSYARETIDQIAGQGVALVEIDKGAFVPQTNINRSRNLTDKDRQQFAKRTGREMRADFKSRLDTKAGAVLATVDSPTIMQRMSQPYKGMQSQSMEKARDQAMAKAVPSQGSKGPEMQPER